uniref:6-bladed beta-propeller n=1 Tax=Lunatimonas salinarum TaxID=1774590 RepID=UPI001AE0BE6A
DFPDMDFAFDDFIVDKEGGTLEIFDAKNSQILIFDLEGLYQSKIDVPFSVIQFEKVSGNYLFFRGNSYSKDPDFDFEMIYLDNDFYPIRNLRNQRREIPEAGVGMVSLCPPKVFSKFAQEVRYNDYFTDTIFTLRGGEIANAIYLDMGNQSPQSTWKTKTNDEIFNHFVNRDLRGYIMSKYIVLEDTEKIWFSVTYEYEGCLALYEKTNGKTTFYRVVDDGKLGLDGYSILTNGTPYQGDHSLICVVYAQDRKGEKSHYKEEGNPSLLILDLAKFPLN